MRWDFSHSLFSFGWKPEPESPLILVLSLSTLTPSTSPGENKIIKSTHSVWRSHEWAPGAKCPTFSITKAFPSHFHSCVYSSCQNMTGWLSLLFLPPPPPVRSFDSYRGGRKASNLSSPFRSSPFVCQLPVLIGGVYKLLRQTSERWNPAESEKTEGGGCVVVEVVELLV